MTKQVINIRVELNKLSIIEEVAMLARARGDDKTADAIEKILEEKEDEIMDNL